MSMTRTNAPKFGNWDTDGNLSNTAYFENARKVPSSEKVNPDTSPENTEKIPKQDTQRRFEASRANHERKVSKDEGELQRKVASPLHLDAAHTPNRTPRPNGGHSPLHSLYQAKIVKGGAMSSPSWERRGSSEGNLILASSTPGRSRLKSAPQGNGIPEKGTAVPKFGEWDETDPSAADGFSQIFTLVKEERHGSVGNAPGSAAPTPRYNGQKGRKSEDSKGCCCFPWSRN